jgi:hypothetical protein
MKVVTDPALDTGPGSAAALAEVAPPVNGATAVIEGHPDQGPPAPHLARFRAGFGRFRPVDAAAAGEADQQPDVAIQIMLLREENARLKAAQHRPPDVGTLIDQMREAAAQKGEGEVLDEAWSVLTECLVIREGLEQACLEIQVAVAALQGRLRDLAVTMSDVSSDGDSDSGDAVPTDAIDLTDPREDEPAPRARRAAADR